MLRVLGLVISLALADSLNPSTVAPALYLAAGQRARRRVLEFAGSVLLVQPAGGVIILLGPGRLLLTLLPQISPDVKHGVETGLGVAMIIAAGLIWHRRSRLAQKDIPDPNAQQKSSWLLGATVMAIELPTAFPYFAAIAAVLSSGAATPAQVLVLVLFNLCFVLPLLAILATLLIAGDHAQDALGRGRAFLQRHWPIAAATILLLGGLYAGVLGASGFAASNRGQLARTVRHARKAVQP